MLHSHELLPSDSGGHLLSTTFGFVALSHYQKKLAELRLSLHSSLSVHACRAQLWRASIPEQAPLAKDVDWEALGKNYELAGGSIKQAVVRAATQAALRIEVTMTCLGTDVVQSQAAYAINKLCSAAHANMWHSGRVCIRHLSFKASAIVSAAIFAGMQDGAAMIKMEDLKAEAKEEMKKSEGTARPFGMYT